MVDDITCSIGEASVLMLAGSIVSTLTQRKTSANLADAAAESNAAEIHVVVNAMMAVLAPAAPPAAAPPDPGRARRPPRAAPAGRSVLRSEASR